MPRQLTLLLIGWLLIPATARSQTLELRGADTAPAAQLARDILAGGAYLLLDRDTLLRAGPADTRNVVVVDARVVLEGTLRAAVAVINGELVVRPGASVGGPIVLLDSQLQLSGLATAGEVLSLPPALGIALSLSGNAYVARVEQRRGRPRVEIPGFFGLGTPAYDRVHGLSLAWNASAVSGGEPPGVRLNTRLRYRSARGRLDEAVELRFGLRGRLVAMARASSETRTMDTWIRGDLANSVAAFFTRSDARNYFHTDELALTVARTPPPPLLEEEGFIDPRVSVRFSRDRSIPTAAPWTVLDRSEPWRENPPIDEGRIVSLVAGALSGWRGPNASFSGAAAVEWAPADLGDFPFTQLSAAGAWQMLALRNHRLSLSGYLLLPIGARAAPRQRWGFVGGSGTLPTQHMAFLRGDHLFFVSSTYLIPVPRVQLPMVGPVTVRLEHAAGAAWPTGSPRALLQQDLAVGIEVMVFNAMLHIDPASRPRRTSVSVGARLPDALVLPLF